MPTCDGARINALCLSSCSLGCRGTRCEITDIAQNENIVLVFNTEVDPISVNENTIQFRTPAGEPPVGTFIVNRNVVEFVPQVLVVGGQSFFGFRAGETYTMTLPGGKDDPNTVKSTSGDPLKETISCSLTVSRGIVDLNNVAPRAEMVLPTTTTNVAQDVTVQLEFNEIIDVTPFLGATAGNGPIVFAVRRTRDNGSGARECSPNSTPVPLGGSPRVDLDPVRGISVVTYRPPQALPGNVCMDITVTDRVRDLSGRPAQPQTFQFVTVSTGSREETLTEEFETDDNLDRAASSGAWGNGTATFGMIGGDARHGAFDVNVFNNLGLVNGRQTYEINTDSTIIPAANTTSGTEIRVTDGKFYFSSMLVPSDVRLRFVGSNPPQFHVAGRVEINGHVELRGEDTVAFVVPTSGAAPGQPGGRAGIFGGAGGTGGDRCLGTGNAPNFNGRNGLDGQVVAGHAYAPAIVGTGGAGSPLWPTVGTSAGLVFPGLTVFEYCAMTTTGGGGGGYRVAGGQGLLVVNSNTNPGITAPTTAGGARFDLFPIPGGARNSLHFLVGGAGGGGGGSHPAFTNSITRQYANGAGGGGGGGAIAIRAGDTLRIASTAVILAQGGSAWSATGPATAVNAAPAGGGAGGSIVLQVGRAADVLGILNVSGGNRGILDRQAGVIGNGGARIHVTGGDGSPGFIRLEVPAGQTASAPQALPALTADNVGVLAEQDELVSFRSNFYSTQQAFGPEFGRYEITALVNGSRVVFSDDTSRGTPARAGQALRAFFQAVTVDLSTGVADQQSLRPWRQNVGSFGGEASLADDALNGFRFLIVLDRSLGQTVEIESVKIVYRI
ncbi:MAG: hypothetical protein IPK26_05075 [Planctomycetes bacterium]|nr:hypothetical protein [Planctomycetota bacterium]